MSRIVLILPQDLLVSRHCFLLRDVNKINTFIWPSLSDPGLVCGERKKTFWEE